MLYVLSVQIYLGPQIITSSWYIKCLRWPWVDFI